MSVPATVTLSNQQQTTIDIDTPTTVSGPKPSVGNNYGEVRSRLGAYSSQFALGKNDSYAQDQISKGVFNATQIDKIASGFPDVLGHWLRADHDDPVKAALILQPRTGQYQKFSQDLTKPNVIRRFLMTSVAWRQAEKYQIVETFGQPIVYFFGERPIFFKVTGVAYDSYNMPWLTAFLDRYDSDLRGTRLNWKGWSVFLVFENNVIEGFITDVEGQKGGATPGHANISFSFLVVQWTRAQSTVGRGGATWDEPEPILVKRARESRQATVQAAYSVSDDYR